ncbi:hypothetical protein CAS74_003570 [Pichia kudriavzevii]|uniref:Uncharacterized protein n=1 Tax=Pichia kudriavzevii TaxID=4909 RepID=A0A1Z8JLZ3_PICKU|nr:hypothetical protein CAS74_003570 [Pichia kudriavzevii]
MSSREILENYLDRDLFEVVSEQSVSKIINVQTQKRLTDKELKILSNLIYNRHNNRSMDRVRENILQGKLQSVVDYEPDSEQVQIAEESHYVAFLDRLKKLNDRLEKEAENIESIKKHKMKLLDKNIKELAEAQTT